MKKRIWITKSSENSGQIFLWPKHPIWEQNEKFPKNKEMGHWTNKDGSGLSGTICCSSRTLDRLFKVKFTKKAGQGYIAERIISITRPRTK